MKHEKTLRLILGDQLNIHHSWFRAVDEQVCYVMMELRSETDYATHHIQKIIGFFGAMRKFAEQLKQAGHPIIYLKLNDLHNAQSFETNIKAIIADRYITKFEYQLPDEYRVDRLLQELCKNLTIPFQAFDTEHFYTQRQELSDLFKGKKTYMMETFYRAMRKKHGVLMNGDEPLNNQWNFDEDNRKKLPKNHTVVKPLLFDNDLSVIEKEIRQTMIVTIGTVDASHFIWPIDREQALRLLDFFLDNCLPFFGTYQDAMAPKEWSMYHSRLSFALNVKLISPQEVVQAAIKEYHQNKGGIAYNQLEGFVRQIIGWREYMRGIYWLKMPDYAQLNYFDHQEKLPVWYWTGETNMHCLQQAIKQSLDFAYAHHIQRLMITGNFALLAGVHPDEVDAWYLGIYIDAIDWVEITNTRGMSQFADGGIVGSKPYVSSATYIDKMSAYCKDCHYDKNIKTGDKACPFNSLYWNFYDRHEQKLSKNPRIGMMYNVWRKMEPDKKVALLEQAEYYLKNIDRL